MLPKTLLVAQEASKEFTLPKLPYATDALVPHIDAKTMEIHHGKHHAGYVANLNKALAGTDWVGKPIEEILANLGKAPKAIQAALRNNGGGHYNHTLFWQVMSAKGGKPSAELAAAIEKSFKSFDAMLAEFKTSAMTRFGSGWAWLVAGKEGKLGILSSANQDNPLMIGAGVPILGIDVWEHAYYLNYQNRRADYVDAFFKVINWDFVSARYQAAVKM
ncbi:MAG: superoxide dismutase [Zavarzinella sp.]